MLLYVLHCFLSTVLLIIWDSGTQGLENNMALCTAIYSLASCKSQKGLRKKFQNSHPVILSSSLLSFAHLVSSQPWSLTLTDKCCRVAEPQDGQMLCQPRCRERVCPGLGVSRQGWDKPHLPAHPITSQLTPSLPLWLSRLWSRVLGRGMGSPWSWELWLLRVISSPTGAQTFPGVPQLFMSCR